MLAYAGLEPSRNESGEKNHKGHISKAIHNERSRQFRTA